jgi:hypothetical protein
VLAAQADASAQHCATMQLSHALAAATGASVKTPPHWMAQGPSQDLAAHESTAPSAVTALTLVAAHPAWHARSVGCVGSQASAQSRRVAQVELRHAATSLEHESVTHCEQSVCSEERSWMLASWRQAGVIAAAAMTNIAPENVPRRTEIGV